MLYIIYSPGQGNSGPGQGSGVRGQGSSGSWACQGKSTWSGHGRSALFVTEIQYRYYNEMQFNFSSR